MQKQEQEIIDNIVKLGIMALNSGDVQRGVQYFEEAIKINFNHVGAYLGLVRAVEVGNSHPYCARLESFPLETIEAYLKQNPELLVSSPVSLLDRAVSNNLSIGLIKVILDAGANPNDDYVLYHAIISGCPNKYELVNLLLDYGADSNIEYQLTFGQNKEMCTPLGEIIWNVKDIELATLLIVHNADVNYISKCDNGESWSLLDMAVRTDNVPMIQLLLENRADPNSGRWFIKGYSYQMDYMTFYCALSEAILVTKNKDVVRLLLKYGANPSYKYKDYTTHTYDTTRLVDGEYERSCLKDAILANSSEMVDMLLEAGADINTTYYSKSYEEHWDDPPNASSILDVAKSNGNRIILALIQGAIDKDNLKKEKESLQKELPWVNGMFANRRRKKIEARLVEIEEKLERM